jgi:hypothetical protein
MLGLDDVATGQDRRAFKRIAQFTYVPRPVVRDQRFARAAGHNPGGQPSEPAISLRNDSLSGRMSARRREAHLAHFGEKQNTAGPASSICPGFGLCAPVNAPRS